MTTKLEGETRRGLLRAAGLGAVGVALVGCCLESKRDRDGAASKDDVRADKEVGAVEDLMREHGALNRILLIYDETASQLEAGKDAPLESLAKACGIVRSFVEDYHEKLEEESVFPHLETGGKLVGLCAELRRQHRAGRSLTDRIERLSVKETLKASERRADLARALRTFVRMYRPHEAREDTVVFPVLKSLMTVNQYEDLGDKFEEKEHELFGKEGFEGIVAQVAELEKVFGLDDLAKFTPAG